MNVYIGVYITDPRAMNVESAQLYEYLILITTKNFMFIGHFDTLVFSTNSVHNLTLANLSV